MPFIIGCCLYSAAAAQAVFRVIPLGVKGGRDESNLSAYAVAAKESENYVCLDAGALNYGLQKAISANLFQGDAATGLLW